MRRIHAPSRRNLDWKSMDWNKADRKVKELQMRIPKAVGERKFRRVKSLQWLLTHSFYEKLLAVRRVVTNKGSRTPGVDRVIISGITGRPGNLHRGRPSKGLSRMTGNCHVRFSGGLGLETAPSYPVAWAGRKGSPEWFFSLPYARRL